MSIKPTLFIMVGIPGSGKSYFVKNNLNHDSIIVSRDNIRFSIINDNDEYFSKEKQVFKEYVKAIQKALNEGKNVYADATHLNGVSRYKLISNLDISNISIVPIMIKTSLGTCLSRNAARTGRSKVPDYVIKNMYKTLTDPANDLITLGKNYYKDILYVKGY